MQLSNKYQKNVARELDVVLIIYSKRFSLISGASRIINIDSKFSRVAEGMAPRVKPSTELLFTAAARPDSTTVLNAVCRMSAPSFALNVEQLMGRYEVYSAFTEHIRKRRAAKTNYEPQAEHQFGQNEIGG